MSPEEINLPRLDPAAINVARSIPLEWSIDPPDLRLPVDLIRELYVVKLRAFAQVAELEAQMKSVQAKYFAEAAQLLAR